MKIRKVNLNEEFAGSEMLRMKDAASFLGCSVSTIYRAIEKNGLPAHRFFAHWVFFEEELYSWARGLKGINLSTKGKVA